ncbi:MAG: hypothetical protein M1832_004243 [Thelocarpon impressellum]|nr:MAG: hypothetical protein M1832_004243 [Thelocarpon impressellum]
MPRSLQPSKRKASSQRDPALDDVSLARDTRQSTLPDLFGASRSTAADPEQRKWRKLGSPPPPVTAETRAGPGARTPMASQDVIDLTGSPAPSSPGVACTAPRGAGTNGLRQPSTFQPRTGAKRLVIKNLRTTPRVSAAEYLDRVWAQLDEALTAIFDGSKVPHSLEELYRGVENVCRQDGAAELFVRMRARCQRHVEHSITAPLLETATAGRGNVDMLRRVHAAWMVWNAQLLTIRSVFFYMDRSYLLSSRTEPTINEMGLAQFRVHVFSLKALKQKLLQGMCDLLDHERREQRALGDTSLLRSSTDMVHDLLVYSSSFEPALLRASEAYYDAWAAEKSADLDLAGYVGQCDRLMRDEMARAELLNLDASTRRDMTLMLQDSLVRKRAAVLTQADELAKLLDADAVAALEQVYSLLRRVRLHSKLRAPWETFIRLRGSDIVGDERREGEMVVRLLEFKTKLDIVWRTSFHKHEELGHALRESFASFINERRKGSKGHANNSKPGEMIAKHVDLLLRGGAKAIPAVLSSIGDRRLPSALSSIGDGRAFGADEDGGGAAAGDEDAELSRQLDQVLDLFRFIEGKDVFEAFYKKDLARRLLMARSASADAERTMLARLKNECGAGFTHNLEQMFKDVDLARDEMASYKAMRAERAGSDALDLNVNVLSAAAWPTYPDVPVNVPQEIGRVVDDYDRHYKSKHTGRRLTWKHALAHCVVRASFPKGRRELVVSSFQAIVMLLFNGIADGASLSYEEIRSATGLSDVELRRTLQSLACAKYRVLIKEPRGREVEASDTFQVNLGFSDAKYRIKVNQIQLKETREENAATHEDVQRDRQYETQAAIVRIMKSRKTITYSELQAETIAATRKRGAMKGSEIKVQIDKLIEKDYMERDPDADGTVYRYLA